MKQARKQSIIGRKHPAWRLAYNLRECSNLRKFNAFRRWDHKHIAPRSLKLVMPSAEEMRDACDSATASGIASQMLNMIKETTFSMEQPLFTNLIAGTSMTSAQQAELIRLAIVAADSADWTNFSDVESLVFFIEHLRKEGALPERQ